MQCRGVKDHTSSIHIRNVGVRADVSPVASPSVDRTENNKNTCISSRVCGCSAGDRNFSLHGVVAVRILGARHSEGGMCPARAIQI